MEIVYNYSIVYHYAPGSGGFSTKSGKCVFRNKDGARQEMEREIEKLKQNKRYGEFYLNSSSVYPIEVK
jgi:hypothetical protein